MFRVVRDSLRPLTPVCFSVEAFSFALERSVISGVGVRRWSCLHPTPPEAVFPSLRIGAESRALRGGRSEGLPVSKGLTAPRGLVAQTPSKVTRWPVSKRSLLIVRLARGSTLATRQRFSTRRGRTSGGLLKVGLVLWPFTPTIGLTPSRSGDLNQKRAVEVEARGRLDTRVLRRRRRRSDASCLRPLPRPPPLDPALKGVPKRSRWLAGPRGDAARATETSRERVGGSASVAVQTRPSLTATGC